MQAGNLRKRLVLQTRSTTRDAAGEPSYTWSNWTTVWGDINPAAGRERLVAQAIASEITHHVSMRYRAGVTADMRVSYQGRYFNVLSVIDVDERHREIQLLCSEGLANA